MAKSRQDRGKNTNNLKAVYVYDGIADLLSITVIAMNNPQMTGRQKSRIIIVRGVFLFL